jgi:hypothetical protein
MHRLQDWRGLSDFRKAGRMYYRPDWSALWDHTPACSSSGQRALLPPMNTPRLENRTKNGAMGAKIMRFWHLDWWPS